MISPISLQVTPRFFPPGFLSSLGPQKPQAIQTAIRELPQISGTGSPLDLMPTEHREAVISNAGAVFQARRALRQQRSN